MIGLDIIGFDRMRTETSRTNLIVDNEKEEEQL